jgi:hypothetical protein
MEYNEARDIMATHKANVLKANGKGKIGGLAPDRKKLEFRTFLYRKESPADDIAETYEIHYFQTAIITLHADKVMLNDGGFFSVSTHERLNEYMPRGFHVHGLKAPWYRSTVGFVTTPAGTAPYNMPQEFTYAGLPTGSTACSTEAGPCFHMIPNYVDGLLDRIFKEPDPVMNELPVTDDRHSLGDRQWPVELLKKQLHRPMLLRHINVDPWLKPTKQFCDEQLDGMSLEEVIDILLKEGAAVLVRPETRSDLARRIEAALRVNQRIPTVNLRALKKLLRMILIEFLIDELGFKDQEWNRRDAT